MSQRWRVRRRCAITLDSGHIKESTSGKGIPRQETWHMDVYPQSRVGPYLLAIACAAGMMVAPTWRWQAVGDAYFWRATDHLRIETPAPKPAVARRKVGASALTKLTESRPVTGGSGQQAWGEPESMASPAAEQRTPAAASAATKQPTFVAHRWPAVAASDGPETSDVTRGVTSLPTAPIPVELPDPTGNATELFHHGLARRPFAVSVADGSTAAGTCVWPRPQSLLRDLSHLDPPLRRWADAVGSQLQRLHASASLDSRTAHQALTHLSGLHGAAVRAIDRDPRYAPLRRSAYGLERRLAIWRLVAQSANPTRPRPKPADLRATINIVRLHLQGADHGPEWDRYLQLDRMYGLSSDGSSSSWSERSDAAADVLRRMQAQHLSQPQQQLLQSAALRPYQQQLRQWVTAGIDLQRLLSTVERFESDPATSAPLAREVSCLAMSPDHQLLWQAFDTHYRNANGRVSVSAEFLQRMAPSAHRIASRIRRELDGVEVRGQNNGWSRLQVALVPDTHRIHVDLRAVGAVQSRTVAAKGPVRLFNTGRSRFAAEKSLVWDPREFRVSPARADAHSGLDLNAVQSDFDGVPLVGWMVRQLARQEHDQRRGLFRRSVQRSVAQAARQRLDEQMNQRIRNAQQRVQDRWIEPLQQLGCTPRRSSVVRRKIVSSCEGAFADRGSWRHTRLGLRRCVAAF